MELFFNTYRKINPPQPIVYITKCNEAFHTQDVFQPHVDSG